MPTTVSISPISKSLKQTQESQICSVSAGCFWGVEHLYNKHFKNRVQDTKVGYANGHIIAPSYKQVCNNTTSHAETVQISFDPSVVTYKELIEFFFLMHDPTTLNEQGEDQGTQYRSAIFVHDDEQLRVVKDEVLPQTQKQWYPNHKIVTVVEPIQCFWDAEEYHQKYLVNNEGQPCATHFVRTVPKV
ncbi:unnamed protein product [Ambrosiozyma monospora]|uniref:peptide-methionine (S)-S-oxide reductase n=1 Tax=Ambrosiozyma monospora TaxID=43982 RepID=A0A9W7DEP9_AMBMO|nr:unnamed protein product [Ambrosiozyma monospora]